MNPDFSRFLAGPTDGYSVLGWIVALPLIGAIINGFFGKRIGRQGVYITGVTTVAASFVLSLFAFAALVKAGGHHMVEAAANAAGAHGADAHGAAGEAAAGGAEHPIVRLSYVAWDWFRAPIGDQAVQLKFRYVLDALSGMMLLVVTGVGTLIHIYSVGYISHDDGYARYFAYLNLFMFAMLNLILGDSIVLLFVGWEGVGLCSYLLIGFWFTNPAYASAGKKAFIVNRIGDVGVIVGMSILAWKTGAFTFEGMRDAVTAENSGAMIELTRRPELDDFLGTVLSFGSTGLKDTIVKIIPTFSWGGLGLFCLFIGCTGKSAQMPLYVWLPDAMAGPTPVSALIHAATMVTAGIYLLCRMSFVYVHFPTVMAVIAVIGALTAFFAATIALVQNELKKVLAYSTVSQLGFMFIGCGVGAFGAGIFHVYTHAMFKACLFLGAGAVMHACRDQQDLRKLGGLKEHIPHTFRTFAIATLAIIGTPGLAGFFSKDEILFRALASHNASHPWVGKLAFALGATTAALTAFYMCRLLFLTFWGDFKGWSLNKSDYPEKDEHAHGDDHGHGHDDHGHGHGNPWDPPHENPPVMTGPLYVLAGMSIVAGYIGLPYLFTHKHSVLAHWLAPVITEWHLDHAAASGTEMLAMGIGIAAFAVGAGLAYWMYVLQNGEPAKNIATSAKPLYHFLVDKWRVDELYDAVIVRPLRAVSNFAAWVFDKWIIDGIVNIVGMIPRGIGALLKKIQTGSIHTYGAFFAVGALLIAGWAVARPDVSVSTRVENGEAVVQAYGGPGYAYFWDPEGDGTFEQNATPEARRTIRCTPGALPDGRRGCRVGVRARNAFGFTATTVRTIEMPSNEGEGR